MAVVKMENNADDENFISEWMMSVHGNESSQHKKKPSHNNPPQQVQCTLLEQEESVATPQLDSPDRPPLPIWSCEEYGGATKRESTAQTQNLSVDCHIENEFAVEKLGDGTSRVLVMSPRIAQRAVELVMKCTACSSETALETLVKTNGNSVRAIHALMQMRSLF